MLVKQTLKELRHFPKKYLGQNFLINENVILKIVDETLKNNPKKIIEIGPGLGSLTNHLKQHKNLVLIEKDKIFYEKWKAENIIYDCALKLDWNNLIEKDTTLVSNLPYKISSRVVIDRSLDNLQLDKMVLMFQKEVSDRILSPKSLKSYSVLSVMAQSFWNIKKLVKLGPKDFHPPPKVFSQVLVFEKKTNDLIEDKNLFLKFVKQAFSNRRKKLVSNVIALKPHIDQNTRAGELSPLEFQHLFCKCTKQNHKTNVRLQF